MSTIESVRILVVSGDPAILRPLSSIGEANGWKLEVAADTWEAMDRVQSGVRFSALLLDPMPEEADEMHTLRWLRRFRPGLPIVLIGHPGSVSSQEESIRLGASDYLIRPVEVRQLEMSLRCNVSAGCDSTEMNLMSDDVEAIGDGRFFVGISPIMRRLRFQAALLAEASVPVLILGEDGAGKETAARLIHRLSVRSAFGFAKVKCSALPGDLLERELFGYQTNGATSQGIGKPGKLELCTKGTVLLEDITEMPPDLQIRLLDALRSGQFIRPGSAETVEADVRLLATSSANIERAVSENRLDENLYRYLADYTVHVPALRERKSEIPSLACHFMHQLARRFGMPPRDFSSAIIEAWQAHDWQGNLQELEDCVKRYLIVGDKELMREKSQLKADGKSTEPDPDLSFKKSPSMDLPASPKGQAADSKSLRSLIQSVKSEAERNAIAVALEKTGWNRKAAARLLKVSYRTVLYKIEQYKMNSSGSSLSPEGNGNGNGHKSVEMSSNDMRG